jgi:hypothetical protein
MFFIFLFFKRIKIIITTLSILFISVIFFIYSFKIQIIYPWISNLILCFLTSGLAGLVIMTFQSFLDQKRYYTEEFDESLSLLRDLYFNIGLIVCDINNKEVVDAFIIFRDKIKYKDLKYVCKYNKGFFDAYERVRYTHWEIKHHIDPDKEIENDISVPEPDCGTTTDDLNYYINKCNNIQSLYSEDAYKIKRHSKEIEGLSNYILIALKKANVNTENEEKSM